ncbi:hypothetical protein FDK38_002042 [Candidozyma auris]|nr:hypothetical protein FDK38_002042 [[Candida] auris]
MNVNPHIHHLQQQYQQQGGAQAGQSPQLSQMSMQHQLQRQQLINQHLQQQSQQQSQQQGGTSSNPLLAALNGNQNPNLANPGANTASVLNQKVNPLLQMQMQQQVQQQQSQPRMFPNQQPIPQQQQLGQAPQQVPIIKDVWNFNLEYEFNNLRNFIDDNSSKIFISIHQEIPGIVARPLGTFKSSADYHFQCLRSNSDILNLIQLSLCAVKMQNDKISNSVIWQFNFAYDVTQEMFNEEHLYMLTQTSQINFAMHMSQGISHHAFAELMIESGLLLDQSINWLSYHSGYDLGFLISLLTNDVLPQDEKEFFWWCTKYFPNFFDLKHIGNQLLSGGGKGGGNSNANNDIGGLSNSTSSGAAGDIKKGLTGNNKPSVEYLAEELHLLPISPLIRQYFASSSAGQFANHQHQQMTSTLHAYLLMECFKELYRQLGGEFSVFEKYKGYLFGLGDATEAAQESEKGSTTKQW